MKTYIALFTSFLLLGNIGYAFPPVLHTRPDEWKEPRIFHTDFDKNYESRIHISKNHINKTVLKEMNKGRVYSDNKAYWFVVMSPDTMRPGPWSTKIEVFNERNYVIMIELINHAATYTTTVKWINEKLLYVEFWWGRVLGTYFIYDVEREKIIIKEMVNDGGIPFQQWRGAKTK
jgi:hypothetical protein